MSGFQITRRQFATGITALAFAGLATRLSLSAAIAHTDSLYGPLIADPASLLDLPTGFSYQIISAMGQTMSDGNRVPDRADGMGAFAMRDGTIALVRNHELQVKHMADGPYGANAARQDAAFDHSGSGQPLPGGTTTLIYNPATQKVEREYLSLTGTIRNCAGGVTPWGSWLTCEEDLTKAGDGVDASHGWVFEVPANAGKLVKAVPLKAMGRFNHEAACVDPRTGIVYLTEDMPDSLFYRFIPAEPGQLAKGGKLQALVIDGGITDTRNHRTAAIRTNDWHGVRWIDMADVESPDDDLRKRGHAAGAALFARGEGIEFGDGEMYFTCTSGGPAANDRGLGFGQVMRYRPSLYEGTPQESLDPGKLQLFYESADPASFNFGDNLTIAPNGHLVVCEDQYTDHNDNHLRGITPAGLSYPLARIRTDTEPAGACFSPDGAILFVNLYSPAKTLAITGPWAHLLATSPT